MSPLAIEVHSDEVVAWKQISHLREWLPNTDHIVITVPVKMPTARLTDTVRLCNNLFRRLQHLEVAIQGASWQVTQAVIGAAAELVNLRSLSIQGGVLSTQPLQIHVLTAIKQLESLSIVTTSGSDGEAPGFGDAHVIDGFALLKSLKYLRLHGDSTSLTNEGFLEFGRLRALRELSVCPIGDQVTKDTVSQLCFECKHLTSLRVGITGGDMAGVLGGATQKVKDLSLVVSDHYIEVSPFFTAIATCLEAPLTSLRITHTVHVEDAFFMVALGSLTALTDLSLTVAPDKPSTKPFTINLCVLSTLKKLKTFEMGIVGKRARLLINPAVISTLSGSWPELQRLALACMVPPEPLMEGGKPTGQFKGPLQPAALTLLGAFPCLRSLSLTSPAPECEERVTRDAIRLAVTKHTQEEDELDPVTVPLSCLPPTLEELEIERAYLIPQPEKPKPASDNDTPHGGANGTGAAQAAAGAVTGSALGKLRSLSLIRSEVADDTLITLFTTSPHITRLEFHEVYGVTAKTLRALSSLLGLQHLEIIDSRDLHGRARAAPGGADGDAAEAQQSYAASWYNWLFGTGTGEEEKGSKQSGAAHPHTGNDLVLHAGDIGELANLTALRHLQWGVGYSLGLPLEAIIDNNGHTCEDPDDLDTSAREAYKELRTAAKTLASLTNLQEVYIDTLHVPHTEDGYWADQFTAAWLHPDITAAGRAVPPATAPAMPAIGDAVTTITTTPSSHGSNKSGQVTIGYANGAGVGGQGYKRAQGGGAHVVPQWLRDAVGEACFCSGSLPVVVRDAWTGKEYCHAL